MLTSSPAQPATPADPAPQPTQPLAQSPARSLSVTVLADNTASGRGLLGEHGWACWIEADDRRLLFDTGQGLTLTHNAAQLGLDLSRLNAIALSHGHYDHAGGLPAVLEANPTAAVFLHPAAIAPKFSPRGDIGSPLRDAAALEAGGRRVVWVEGPMEVLPGLWLTGPIPRRHPAEDNGGHFWQDGDRAQPDPLLDDMALFARTSEGIVVVLGCTHAGLANTLNYIVELAGSDDIRAVIGGTHLWDGYPGRLAAATEALQRYDRAAIAAGHCTGQRARAALWHQFGDRCQPCQVGARWQWGG